jgi:Activator of Hsp90 ATPase homolog 1-like protein
MKLEDMTLDIEQRVEVKAAIGDVFKGLLHRFGEGFTRPNDGESMQLILEPWPGGRWFRDRGNQIGHLWGHVQVMKPPVLLELSGPMFMSYPAINHLELRLEEMAGGTRVILRHRAIGMLDPEHRQGVSTGWKYNLEILKKDLS